jgi:hypothetical protein
VISTRYVPAIVVLLALALVPTLIHSYSDSAADDGRRTRTIPTVLAGYPSVASDRPAGWGQRRFKSNDWIERHYVGDRGAKVTLTVVRTYDTKSVYHHPELAVSYHRASFMGERVESFKTRPDVPIHVLQPSPGRRAFGMYVLHYEDRFVDNPLMFQIRSAGELLFSRRQPMTLFFVLDDAPPSNVEAPESSAARVLFAAIDALVLAD